MLTLFRVLSTHNVFNSFKKCNSVLSKHVHLSGFHNIRMKNNTTIASSFFKPVDIRTNSNDINVGAEIVGKLDKNEVIKALNKFTQKQEIKTLCFENGIDGKVWFKILIYVLLKLQRMYYIF